MNLDDITKVIGRLYLDLNITVERLQRENEELRRQLEEKKPLRAVKAGKE